MIEELNSALARTLLPTRPADAHKYTFGKVLVVAGSPNYPGAASLATAGAARIGAGLVCLATGRSTLGGPGRLAEIINAPLPEAEWGVLGTAAADELLKEVSKYQALLVGPGLGRERATREFLDRLLGLDAPSQKPRIGFRIGDTGADANDESKPSLPPIILDADALNLLANPPEAKEPPRRGDFFQRAGATESDASEPNQWWEQLPKGCILTPHAGEMARLLGVESISDEHEAIASEAATRWGQIVVLKGPTTIIADPAGRVVVHNGANPALATAGTGDVLAGAIAGLVAQGLAPYNAALLGVFIHSAAGRLVAADLGDMGTLASDLLPRLPLAIKALRSK